MDSFLNTGCNDFSIHLSTSDLDYYDLTVQLCFWIFAVDKYLYTLPSQDAFNLANYSMKHL